MNDHVIDVDASAEKELSQPRTTFRPLDNILSMKQELDLHGNMLGKTWCELSSVLSRYQAELVSKYERYEASLGGDDNQDHISRVDSLLEEKDQLIVRLEKTIREQENKLAEKDSEIVKLRTSNHQLTNDVNIKTMLISKIQNQMAKESMEYSSEINALKGYLEVEEASMNLAPATYAQQTPRRKTRRSSPVHQVRILLEQWINSDPPDYIFPLDSFSKLSKLRV